MAYLPLQYWTEVIFKPTLHLNVFEGLSLRLGDEEECEGGDGRDEHGEDPEGPVLPERRHHRAEEPSHHEGHRPVEAG